jgi:hypothetical protein
VAIIGAALAFAASRIAPHHLKLSKNYYLGTAKTASMPAVTNATGTASATTNSLAEILAAKFKAEGLQLANSNQVIVLLQWQQRLTGPIQDNLVIVDGKKMRHGGVEMVNATNGQGHYLGGVITQTKSNEIPAARQVLGKLDLQGKIVLTDALHTQVETGQLILFEKGGDYLMTVKANQPTLQETLQGLFEKQVFPPSGPAADQSTPT